MVELGFVAGGIIGASSKISSIRGTTRAIFEKDYIGGIIGASSEMGSVGGSIEPSIGIGAITREATS